MCPFSILAFLQPTTVDKEPKKPSEDDFFFLNRILVKAKFALDKFNDFDNNNH